MNNTVLGKVNFGLGIILFILGLVLFINRFNGSFIFSEQLLSISFICLGFALFCASYIAKKSKDKQS
ncbi:hypothetical protein [Bacillus massilinigeriensis]|uniref:hypothetical protein n=1 Tax=Bacillus mediterraneensis TaxID=1805474 RepID=UPI0008F9300A|nr:hypothetical protein [Bacillus mediterraneensis]